MNTPMHQFHRNIATLIRRGDIQATIDADGAVTLCVLRVTTTEQMRATLTADEYRRLWLAGRVDGAKLAQLHAKA